MHCSFARNSEAMKRGRSLRTHWDVAPRYETQSFPFGPGELASALFPFLAFPPGFMCVESVWILAPTCIVLLAPQVGEVPTLRCAPRLPEEPWHTADLGRGSGPLRWEAHSKLSPNYPTLFYVHGVTLAAPRVRSLVLSQALQFFKAAPVSAPGWQLSPWD